MAKILVVDDSETLRDQLKEVLEKQGHQVIQGHDGVNGLEVLKANPDTSLIICDVNMPNMNGLTMCGKVKDDSSINKIPIFMLTTESDEALMAQGKGVGVIAWITKPFVEAKLLGAVNKILSMKK
ncbi:MAG: response regulator [Oligoflexia bacterium]|nr:response regulator [Oligoflexia bacterium]